MRPAILLLLLSVSLAAQPASIDGIVVNHLTGKPLSDVHVRLLTGDFASQNGGLEQVYGAISDQAGHFSVTGMKPSLYLVVLERTGFVQELTGGALPMATTGLKPGQHLADYKLEMSPRAMIAGRVVDEYGDPVQFVSVQVQSLSSNSPPPSLFGNLSGSTDDRGEFRIFIGPGKYHLQATPRNYSGMPSEIRTDGTSAAAYSATYYPSSANKNGAAVVEATAGQDVTGLEIRLTRASGPTRALTIGGVVTGAPEGARALVTLRSGDSPEHLNGGPTIPAGPDGKFSFPGQQPGFYRLHARYSSARTALQSQVVELRLTGSDETNVQLVLAPAGALTGRLEILGSPPPGSSTGKLTVRLEPAEFLGMGEQFTGEVDKDGGFRIPNVLPGRFRARVEPLPENAYIKTVTLDGAAAPDGLIDLSRDSRAAVVKITVSRNGGQISGRLVDKGGAPVSVPLVMVFLATDPKQMQEENTLRTSDGKYSMKGIRPGKYHLFALDVLQLASSMINEKEDEMMKTLFAAGEEIEIKEGDRIVKDLKVIDKLPAKEPAHDK